jgi:hypothetical protein
MKGERDEHNRRLLSKRSLQMSALPPIADINQGRLERPLCARSGHMHVREIPCTLWKLVNLLWPDVTPEEGAYIYGMRKLSGQVRL